MVIIFSFIFSLPGLRIEFFDKYMPRILIDSLLGKGVMVDYVCGWIKEKL